VKVCLFVCCGVAYGECTRRVGKMMVMVLSKTKAFLSNLGCPILVPLTPSLYVPGTLASVESVLVDVGTGFFVEKVCRGWGTPFRADVTRLSMCVCGNV